MSYLTDPAHWALCYLRGRADAFLRGRLTIANVLGGVRQAVALGASDADIAALLAGYRLTWDVEHDELHQFPRLCRPYGR